MMQKILIGLVVTIFGGIVLHAPISVGLGTLFPDYSLFIKAWKEVLLGIAFVLLVIEVIRQDKWREYLKPLFWLTGAYALLHLLVLPFFDIGLESVAAGLMINLRYLLFFVVVYGVIKLYPSSQKPLLTAFWVGLAIVVGFATLQLTVLPYDFLKYLGYGADTISPYLTVDENMDYIRISSTLRGPNPLGAYFGIAMAAIAAYWAVSRAKLSKNKHWLLGAGFVLSFAGLWFSYSRSALVGAAVAVAIVLAVLFAKKITKPVWIALAVVALAFGGALYAFKDSDFVSHVILHEDPNEGNDINSNDGHFASLDDGWGRMMRQPFGAGVGSTGSASLLAPGESLIIENQYLFIAHEVGWLGLALFIVIFVMVMQTLWRRRGDWLALAVFASGVGMALIGLLLPVWVDDTVSIIWWGLAAIVLARPTKGVRS